MEEKARIETIGETEKTNKRNKTDTIDTIHKTGQTDKNIMLSLEHVSKVFAPERAHQKQVRAVDDLSLEMRQGERVMVVGESGCGKSTLVRMIAGIEMPTGGTICFDGKNVPDLRGEELRQYRRQVQMVFQDSGHVISPRMTIEAFLREPWICFEHKSRREADEMVRYSIQRVGLDQSYLKRRPHQLSGGELQRICVARAIALHPRLLICDEATSALDVSVQKQILDLIREHVEESGCSVLFICHDLALAENFGDRIAVMYLGRIVEWMEGKRLKRNALHPYTRLLLDSVFSIYDDPGREIPFLPEKDLYGEDSGAEYISGGAGADQEMKRSGCVFCERCLRADEECRKKRPELRKVSPGHFVACLKA